MIAVLCADSKFSVTLSFNGKKKSVVVPYNSICSFSDPSVGFGLQFKNNSINHDKQHIENVTITENMKTDKLKPQPKDAEIVSLDKFRPKKNE